MAAEQLSDTRDTFDRVYAVDACACDTCDTCDPCDPCDACDTVHACDTCDAFDVFYRRHAPAVFELALRHGGAHMTAVACVDAVFSHLSDHWGQISDPLRFTRRAAVLFVCGTRRRRGRALRLCRTGTRSRGAEVSHLQAAG